MKRRDFITSAMCFGLMSTRSAEARERVVIMPNTELALRNDLYARMARNGRYSAARVAYRINRLGGARTVLVYVSPDVSSAKLVVFSHGALATPDVYAPLLEFLTTHGYCVIAPLHDDGPLDDLREVSGSSEWKFPEKMTDMHVWERRMHDCMDVLEAAKAMSETMGVEIDATNPVFMGHSFGALTGLLLSGATVEGPEGTIKGISSNWAGRILLSPPGNGVFGLNATSWETLAGPSLTVTNPDDQGVIGQSPEAKLDSFYLPPEGYRHLAYLQGGGPSIYSGQAARPKTKEYYIFFDLRGAIGAFVSAYADRNEEAFNGLYDGTLEHGSYKLAAIRSR